MAISLTKCILCALFAIGCVTGHITLTFPQARYPPFDFLDTSRTDPPCGVPMPRLEHRAPTYLNAGSKVNITWSMAYAHQGGFQIEILNKDGTVREQLTPAEPPYVIGDQTQSSYEVTIPNIECKDCALRLKRQAVEWGNYMFWSCADVHIEHVLAYSTMDDCSGRGSTEDGQTKCTCTAPYFGKYCQFKEECLTDQDCNNHGTCTQLQTSSPQKNQCYCRAPYFGRNCQKEFTPSSEDQSSGCFNYQFNQETLLDSVVRTDCYKSVPLRGGDVLYYRVLSDDIEIILSYETKSWMGVGWRPMNIDPACYDFPVARSQNAPTNLHPMDCTDIIIGTVSGERLSHVEDYYTRDRSTPLPDDELGGTDNLKAAMGFRYGNRTTILFRKPLAASEKTDHTIEAGRMFLIWAKGMDQTHYSFNVPSGVDVGDASDKQFYKQNEIKYHGNLFRGVSVVDFIDGTGVSTDVHVIDGNVIAEPIPHPENHDHDFVNPEPPVGEYNQPSYAEGEPKQKPQAEPPTTSEHHPHGHAEGEPTSNKIAKDAGNPSAEGSGKKKGSSGLYTAPKLVLHVAIFHIAFLVLLGNHW